MGTPELILVGAGAYAGLVIVLVLFLLLLRARPVPPPGGPLHCRRHACRNLAEPHRAFCQCCREEKTEALAQHLTLVSADYGAVRPRR